MDQPKIERMLRLMKMMSGNLNYTVNELAERLGTTYRSIYRYIDTFKECGFAVEKLQGGVYKLTTVSRNHPNFDKLLYFSQEEAYLVNSLIDRLDPTNALKAELKRKLAVIYDSTAIADFVDKRSNAANVEELGKAIRAKRKVILGQYESGNSHTVRDRQVEPFAFTTNFIDVWAYDLEDGHNKLFKVSRIDSVDVLEEKWEHEKAHRRQGMDVFRMTGHTGKRVQLRMSTYAKDLLVEEHPLAEKDVKRQGQYWLLDTEIFDYAGICRFYLGLADQIKIVESPEFEAYASDYVKKHLV